MDIREIPYNKIEGFLNDILRDEVRNNVENRKRSVLTIENDLKNQGKHELAKRLTEEIDILKSQIKIGDPKWIDKYDTV